ncbi:MAG TPA: glycosyltransferase family 2 protein [Clostridiales bacterium]|nr:glycosyltransferase family 2 protein [Clostridiales bacterium]
MDILIIIPAFNEEKSITSVISQIRLHIPEADILVINDGSTDSTGERAKAAGANVVNLPFNLGIGGAMQTGYLYARYNNYDIAIQVDGDGQHDPSYIHQLIKPVLEDYADMVIGSRYIQETAYKSSAVRRVGMVFFSLLVKFLTDQHVKDTTSGFRAINRNIINYFSLNYPVDYPEVDVLVKLKRKKFKVMEIPVEMKTRKTGKSSITPIRSIYYMIKVTLSLLIETVKTVEY